MVLFEFESCKSSKLKFKPNRLLPLHTSTHKWCEKGFQKHRVRKHKKYF